ncbi:MAG: DNA polymerase III subunit alpha [Bacteroidetes bacterium]|nr:DNA polymerase III subunit alpha [Bacteroidota bacterium]
MSEFVHIHNHTHYSVLDAIATVKELVSAAKEDNQTAIAITDHGGMFGVIEFYLECEKQNIKPIIGCEVYIANGSRLEQDAGKQKTKKKNYFHLLLLAKNEIGYKNLIKLSSLAHTEGFYYRPRIDKELLEKYCEGLICSSACMGGIIPALILDNSYDEAKKEALYYKGLFGDDFYIEIQNHHYDTDEYLIKKLVTLAREIDVKVVATNDIHYLKKEHALAHNVYMLIKDAKGKNDVNINELRYKTNEFYFRTQEEMKELFKNYPDAISNTLEIAEKCNLKIELNTTHLPDFIIPETSTAATPDEYLKELVLEGLEKKYDEVTDEIRQRAEFELNVIANMKFPGYFLIVWDFIREANKLGVSVGPGRGSAAGSIVAYALNITNIEPLKYGLLFERFLNPERVSMPDIDIDFSDETRDKIIKYVQDKYGTDAVSQIITFGTLKTKNVIKDVGRVLGLPLDKVNKITKEIGLKDKIMHAKKMTSLQWTLTDPDERYRQLWEFCSVLEDKNRNLGTHAAGVVIAPGNISDYVPLYKPDKSDDSESLSTVTQYEMKFLEKAGLVKMDFLGLRTLSIIDRTLEMIKENYNKIIDLDKIDFDDQEPFKMLGNGQTTGIFQFESNGMTEYLKQLKPNNLDELTAMNALYRPGPMSNIPSFINRKQGKEAIKYLHPLMEKSLKQTYGVIVYQEQVMQLVQDLGGFTLGKADLVRRAMGKKQLEELLKERNNFAEGCVQKGIKEKTAIEIWDLIEKFANYGFNKSHSLAYSYLAFQTAWLKRYYTAEFLAANMTASMDDQGYLVVLFDEAKRFGINVLPPDVNTSGTNFIAKNNNIYFGMAGIKGVGSAVADIILEQRKKQPFKSIFDFAVRVEKNNKRTLEALICSGAFDSIHSVKMRSQLFNSIDLILEYAKGMSSKDSNNMDDMFGGTEDIKPTEPQFIFSPEWNYIERISKEKDFLNFYISGHPLDEYYAAIKSLNSADLSIGNDDVFENNDYTGYGFVSGIITSVRTREDKKGNKIAFAIIQNYEGAGELIFWSDAYNKFHNIIVNDAIVCAIGKIEKGNGEQAKITVDNLLTLDEAIKKYTVGIQIYIDTTKTNISQIDKTKDFAKQHSQVFSLKTNFIFVVNNKENDYTQKLISDTLTIPYNLETTQYLSELFAKENVSLILRIPSAPNNTRRRW